MTDGDTDTPDDRYWLTNDGLAWFLSVSFVAYVFAPLTPWVAGYPETNAVILASFTASFGIAIAWAFGKDAVEAWRGSEE